jgi:hypothetical protein
MGQDMAIYHLAAKVGSRGGGQSAAATFAYLCQVGRYGWGNSELVHAESRGLPAWAATDPALYWKAADRYERANGRLYQQVEIGLPRELNREQQIALAQSFAAELAATGEGSLPYTLVVHHGGGHNPHAHVLLSERVTDGHERTPESWFRRAAAGTARRELGGARKTSAFQPREWVSELRACWAERANAAMEAAGVEARIDHRSHAARGLLSKPTVHQGPPGLQRRERGLPGDRAARNAEIRAANIQLGEIRTQSATAQRQLEVLQRQLGQGAKLGPTVPARPAMTAIPAAPAETAELPAAVPTAEVLRFIEVHRKDFATRSEASRWFDREASRLGVVAAPATARGLFEDSLAAVERDRADFGNVLEKALVSPRWREAPLSVRTSIVEARREVAEWTATAAALARKLAAHRDGRSLWRRLLSQDPQRLSLERERDSALARVELHRAMLDRIEARWEQEKPDWEHAAAAKHAERREKQREIAERLGALRPAVLAELQRREDEPQRRQREIAEQAAYIHQSLDRGVSAEELWLDLLLQRNYSRQEQVELDTLIREIQVERKRQVARASKSRTVQFGVEWIGFN